LIPRRGGDKVSVDARRHIHRCKTPSETFVMQLALLGGLAPREFLKRYWQKKPLLVRGAIPAFRGFLDREVLCALACDEDAQAHLVTRRGSKWSLERGPFRRARFRRMPRSNWTLLLQDVNHFSAEAAALLQRFAFIPHARLDDLMVSYAAPGGGVGPHVDSYDVFLLQALGERRWQISAQSDHTIRPGLPLKILANFVSAHDWVLQPGDMLYLPPGYAHHGTALSECMTYSVGFRAPSAQQLAAAFLDYLQDRLEIPGMYRDPGLALQKHPGEITPAMLRRAGALLKRIRWRESEYQRFFGSYLTEPKAHVFFTPPRKPLAGRAFARELARHGIALDLKSLLLLQGRTAYMNGDEFPLTKQQRPLVMELADRRALKIDGALDPAVVSLMHDWYRAGYVVLNKTARRKKSW
jgi:50S ribosomal protein L16 3-hydroxylase